MLFSTEMKSAGHTNNMICLFSREELSLKQMLEPMTLQENGSEYAEDHTDKYDNDWRAVHGSHSCDMGRLDKILHTRFILSSCKKQY